MQITRALGCQGKENIGRIVMVLGVVSEFGIVGALSCFGVPRIITRAWGRENKVAKDRTVGLIKE
jgi:hypothetical protein